MRDLPHRLKTFRRARLLTLEQLAERTNLTKSYLSKLERGLSEPSISTVLKLAAAYDVDISELIGTEKEDGAGVSVVRFGERTPLDLPNKDAGYHYEAVAGKRTFRSMNPFIVRPPHQTQDAAAVFPHAGEEFMLVLKGSATVSVGEQTFELASGDSIYFDSELPHKLLSTSPERAEVLVVATNRRSY